MLRPHSLSILLALTTTAAAQGAVETIALGRDFVQHKLLSPGLTDTWKFTVEGDEMLLCTVSSGAFDPVLDLVDEAGNVLAENDGAGTRSELWQRIERPGAYAFRVRGFESRGGGNYEYRLHRFRTSPLASTGEATHTFGESGWWHFRVPLEKGDVLVPTVLGEGRLGAVLDSDRMALPERHGGYCALRSGDHFVRIEGARDRRCQVLTQLARIAELAHGDRVDARIAAYGLDSWRVRVPARQCVMFDLRTPEVLLDCELRELHPDGRGPAVVPIGQFDKGGVRRRPFFVRRDCILEVTLRHAGSAASPYSLSVGGFGQDARIGEPVAAQLPLGDGVLFHLDLPAGEMVELSLESESFDPKLELHDPEGNLIAQVDDRSLADRNPLHRFLVTRPGVYHVLAHCGAGLASGAFVLRSNRQSLPQVATGQSLAVRPGDHVHLELDANESVWLSLRSASFDAALQVVDPAGDAGFVAEGGGLGGDVLVAYRASHRGRHTLIVHSRSGHGDGELRVVRP